MVKPVEDAADIIGRLLVRVYEIHERVITRGGGGLEGIRDATLLHAAVARPFATFGEVELYHTLLSAKFKRLDDLESRFQADLDNICGTFNVERRSIKFEKWRTTP